MFILTSISQSCDSNSHLKIVDKTICNLVPAFELNSLFYQHHTHVVGNEIDSKVLRNRSHMSETAQCQYEYQ